jgi:hypothetical protein
MGYETTGNGEMALDHAASSDQASRGQPRSMAGGGGGLPGSGGAWDLWRAPVGVVNWAVWVPVSSVDVLTCQPGASLV